MSYIEGEGTLINANMKKGGKMILQIEVNGDFESKEDYFHLRKMIERNIKFSLNSQVVSYNVQINARTEKPIKSYKVDEHGVVSEIQPEGEQLELDLSVPKKQDPVENVPEEISREIVDEFILALLAPGYDDMPYPFYAWVARLNEGDTYSKIAHDEAMSSGKLVDLIDEYRARVAPLAAKWDEWRQNGGAAAAAADDQPEEEAEDTNQAEAGDADEPKSEDSGEDIVFEDGLQQEPDQSVEDELSDWEKEILGESDQEQQQPNIPDSEPAAEDLDEYILQEKPRFDDIPYDFPALLERKKNGETWMQIAKSIGTRSGLLSTAWTKYRKRVKEQRNGGVA